MRLLGRLLRRKAGPTPTRPTRLIAIEVGDEIDVGSLVGHHNEVVRALQSAQRRLEILTDEQRRYAGRIDTLEGNRNTTMGDAWAVPLDRVTTRVTTLEERVNNGRVATP